MDGLLIHDGKQNVELIQAALSEDGCTLEATESTTAALRRIQVGVGVVLVAVASIDDELVHFAQSLRDEGLFAGAMLLLCRGRQSGDAFRMCRDGAFEDYVTVDPLYDTYRLRLTVHRALQLRRGDQTRSALAGIGQEIALARDNAHGASVDVDRQAASLLRSLVALLESAGEQSIDQHAHTQRAQILDEVASLRSGVSGAFASLTEDLSNAESAIQSARRSEPVRVMLVDDDPAAFELVREIIGSVGYAVSWVEDPRDTVSLARRGNPQAILLDLEMPSMSGLDVLRAIRSDPDLRRTPVLLLTGRNDRPTVMTAKQIGFQGYLLKPPKRSELVGRLAQLVA